MKGMKKPPPEPETTYTDALREATLHLSTVDLSSYTDQQLDEINTALADLSVKAARESFYIYAKLMLPTLIPGEFKDGRHIEIVCGKLQELYDRIQRKEKGGKKLRISLPPGSTKTLLCSILFPSWCLGKDPTFRVLAIAHASKHAEQFLGRVVKNLVMREEYKAIFPEVHLAQDSKAAAFWSTTKGGYYGAFGVCAQIAGKRANLSITDDIVSEQTAYSTTERSAINRWYIPGLRTRLLPEAGELQVLCLTGDTPIHMADGSWQPLSEVTPGERVVTWADGGTAEAKEVLAMTPQGEAEVYKLTTKNATVKATDRHPFLVLKGDHVEYTKIADLQVGDEIVMACEIPYEEKNPFEMSPKDCWLLGFMFGDGWVTLHPNKKGSMRYATCVAKGVYPDLNEQILVEFERLFGKRPKETKYGYYRFEIANAGRWFLDRGLVAGAHRKRIPKWMFRMPRGHREAFLDGFVDADGSFCEVGMRHVTLCNRNLCQDLKHLAESLGYRVSNIHHYTGVGQPPGSPKPITYHQYHISIGFSCIPGPFRTTKVTKIELLPEKEEVYDLSIKDNPNFLADGLVSHNTRWHPEDVAGFIEKQDEEIDPWETVAVPALLDQATWDLYTGFGKRDPEKYVIGETYWPEYKPTYQILQMRDTLPAHKWSALYLQNPIVEEGSIFKEKKFKHWLRTDPPEVTNVIISVDTAFTEEERKQAAYSAYTIWGIFPSHEVDSQGNEFYTGNLILLGADKGMWSYPELCATMQHLYDQYKDILDFFLVEKRASGISLIQDMRAKGIPVMDFFSEKSKEARAWGAVDLVESGKVWLRPDKNFSKFFLGEVAQFPLGGLDISDTFTQAVLWTKQNWQVIPDTYLHYGEDFEDEMERRRSRSVSYWQAAGQSVN